MALMTTTKSVTAWNVMPDELKVMVLRDHLISHNPLDADDARDIVLPLALTSKSINSMVWEIIWEENTFVAKQTLVPRKRHRKGRHQSRRVHTSGFRYPNPTVSQHIRKLEVQLSAPFNDYQGSLRSLHDPYNGWRHLLRANGSNDTVPAHWARENHTAAREVEKP